MSDISSLLSQRIVEKVLMSNEMLDKHMTGEDQVNTLMFQKLKSGPGDILIAWPKDKETYLKVQDMFRLVNRKLADNGVTIIILPPDLSDNDVVFRTVLGEELIEQLVGDHK